MARIIYILPSGEAVAKWCKRNNISYYTVTNYLKKGHLVEDACLLAKKAHENKINKPIITYNNIPLIKLFSTSKYTAIVRHIRKTGCSVEEAIKKYEQNLTHPRFTKKFNKKGIQYGSFS